MNIKKIMTFIALAILCSATVFANNEKALENPSFNKINNEIKESDLDIKKEINKNLNIHYETKDINTKFVYLNLQSYILSPEIGLGFRHKINTYGYDINFALDPILSIAFRASIVFANANLLKYFNSKNNSNYYIGLGATNFFALKTDDYFPFFYAPGLCIGKQFEKSFVQLKVLFLLNSARLPPIPSLSVGFAF